MSMTAIAPIGARQINSDLYVGHSDLTTIQKAVTAAVATGGYMRIVVPVDHTFSDSIGAVTGGSSLVYITDERNSQPQWYLWNGTGYVNSDVIFVGQLNAYGGISTEIIYVGQTPLAPGAKVAYIGTNPATNSAAIQALTWEGTNPAIYDQTLLLNPLGGNLQLGKSATLDESGNLTTAGWVKSNGAMLAVYPAAGVPTSTGTAWGASIALAKLPILDASNNLTLPGNLSVGGVTTLSSAPISSPLQAATKEYVDDAIEQSGNFVYPNAGIAVSTGAAWAAPINPATLATWPGVGIPVSTGAAWGASVNPASLATYPASGIAVSTGAAWAAPINPATLATYPPAGVPTSTGAAWGTSIPAANLALLNAANTFTQPNIFNQAVSVNFWPTTLAHLIIWDRGGSNPGQTQPNINTVGGGGLFLNGGPNAPIYFNQDSGNGVVFANGAGAPIASVDSSGKTTALAFQWGGPSIGDATISHAGVDWIAGTNETRWTAVGNANTSAAGFRVSGFSANYSRAVDYIKCYDDATNYHTLVTGVLDVAGTKNFRIPYPLDDSKDLIHSSLEGPEVAVFYRGEVTTVNGKAEVELPDYFEPLTFVDNRTVLLTQIFEDGDEGFAMLMASRVIDGAFSIRSSTPSVKVWWEVKAVRRIGTEGWQVVVDRMVQPREAVDEERQRATERTGNDKDGKLRAKASGSPTADAKQHRAARRVH